jgi:hypothetical protein
MATDHHSHGNPMENAEVSYEKRDLGARSILLFFAVLFIVGVIVHFVIWGVYGVSEKIIARYDPTPNPVKAIEETPKAVILQNTPMVNLSKFAQPRLQYDDVRDMSVFSWQEDQILRSKAWVDDKGAVHLPIDVAKAEILKRGLPTRATGAAASTATATTAYGTQAQNAKQSATNAPAVKK